MSTVKRTTITRSRPKKKNAGQTVTVVTQPKRQQPKKKKQQNQRTRAVPNMSECARDYARALANPFNGPLACVPSFPSFLTRKVRTWAKGTFTTSSGGATPGFGYLLFDPVNMAVNDVDAVAGSTAATAINTTASTAAVDPNIALFRGNADYANAQLGIGSGLLQFRVVAGGVRIRYIGTNLNKGGSVIALHEPDHDSLSGQTINNFDAQTESKRFTVSSDRWTTVLWRPVNTNEVNMRPNASGGTQSFPMGFVVSSAAPSQNFEFEAYAIIEYEGRIARGKTPSHVDPVGFASVYTVSTGDNKLAPDQKNDEQREYTLLQEAADYLMTKTSNAVPAAAELAKNVGQIYNMHRAMNGAFAGSGSPYLQ